MTYHPLGRRTLALAGVGVLASAGLISALAAPTKDEELVTAAVENFRKAMIAADRPALAELCADTLQYGHSNFKLENKAQFLDGATSGKSTWKFITLSEQTTQMTGDIAASRFLLTGENVSEGKTNPVKIGVLMVWQKQAGHWKLLARQAAKV
jgi:ketosteroid isomerase-like protein